MDRDRYVPFTTVFNFRDLGGYPTDEGRRVRSGVLYRSDGLHRLAETDFGRFAALGVRRVVDLRRTDEVANYGRVPDSPGLDYHNVCLQTQAWTAAEVAPGELAGYLTARYAEIADEAVGGAMARVLRLIAEDTAGGTVFHCMAGKDRTGVVAAVVLSLLGVGDDTVADDYAASRFSEQRYLAWRATVAPDAPKYLPSTSDPAPAETMLAFLADLRSRYGSVTGYLDAAGFGPADRALLRTRLLAPN
ncbi:protein-tyrosine-phosphatase [Actinocatenispora thailandica]|uniref:Protein-tyrosine-phosphatase n=1 Tax=Actinocatenispora thailandica TaxID=227318 RepID=A0A7R7HYU0_9ACTN|nr:tyrosine-protein phosphatase [Actinocatenispora thailandica]BCJ36619.1 protein-tyrosine-phosphatase [Actinocatenispora thailandica]